MRSPTCCRCVVAAPLLLMTLAGLAAGCSSKEPATPPLATPSVALARPSAPLGSPLDITYKFVVAPGAHFEQDYRVMVHVVDVSDELIWTDDHNPPTPTTQWKPGQTVEYVRTIFIPIRPYVGEATIQIGLYTTVNQKRAPLNAQDAGQRAYKVAKLQLLPQTENVLVVFKEGWHPAEGADHNASVEWQWTKKDATLTFKNPRKDSTLYLDTDNPGSVFHDNQVVQLSIGGQPIAQFTITPGQQVLKKILLTAAQLGGGDNVEVQISVDKTFVPALMLGANSKDPRELGIRVFHAFVQPAL
jgi:hypothetical protein